MTYTQIRTQKPRLYRAPDDPDFNFPPPRDPVRKRILENVVASCEAFLEAEPPKKVPQLERSPYPHHNLYLCFYNAMMGQSMVEHFSFGYRMTGDSRYARQAARWVRAMVGWDYTINTFYSSARIMHALAVAEDWLGDRLTESDLEAMHNYNAGLCRFHEETIDNLRASSHAGDHAHLYVTHFGIAALSLLGVISEAETWLDWAVEKCKKSFLRDGVAEDGTFHHGANWAWSYTQFSKLLFLDALKNVTGIDLYESHRDDIGRALRFIHHAYVGGKALPAKNVYGPDENLLTGSWQLDSFSPTILKLASLTGDRYAQWVGLRDPNLGKIQRTDFKVKEGAELIFAWSLYAYLWYDPSLEPVDRPELPPSRVFPSTDYVVMRSGWNEPIMVLGFQGHADGCPTHDPSSFLVHWNGRPLIRRAPAPNTVPLPEGNAPALGGEMELRGKLTGFVSTDTGDAFTAIGFLITQEFGLLRDPYPAAMVRVRARRRTPDEARLETEGGERFLRLGEGGYLQYVREGNFNADEGSMRIRFRLREPLSTSSPMRILIGTGNGIRSGAGSSFHLGLFDGKELGFLIRDHQARPLETRLPLPNLEVGVWYEASCWWRGLNRAEGVPEIGLAFAGEKCSARPDLPPEAEFTVQPNTNIWVGAAVQTPETHGCVDLARLEIFGPEDTVLLSANYAQSLDAVTSRGNGKECAEGPLELRLHPYDQVSLTPSGAQLINDGARLEVVSLPYHSATFELQPIPYAQAGLASGSFVERPETYHRLIVRPAHASDVDSTVTVAFLPTELDLGDRGYSDLIKRFEKLIEKVSAKG